MRAVGVVAIAAAAALAPSGGGRTTATAAGGGCAAGMHRAVVVAQHSLSGGGGSVAATVCFAAPSISGEQVVRSSGIEYALQQFGGFGEAVCQLDQEPATYPAGCFGTTAWALFVSRACGPWVFSLQGISTLSIGDGDLIGFHYVPAGSQAPPPGPAGSCPAPDQPAPTPPPTGPPPASPRAAAASTPPAAPRASIAAPAAALPRSGQTTARAGTVATSSAPAAGSAAGAAPVEADASGTTTLGQSIAAGTVQRSGLAPPPSPGGTSVSTWVLVGVTAVVLAGLSRWQLRRRRT